MSVSKSPDAFRTISEVADDLNVPQHVLRFWETKFSQVKPLKRGGGRRYYRPNDIDLLKGIQKLLHEEGFTIRGVQKVFRKEGVRFVASIGRGNGAALSVTAETALAVAETPDAQQAPAAAPRARRRLSAPAGGPQQLSLVPDARVALSADDHATLTRRLDTLMGLRTRLTAALEAREERIADTHTAAAKAHAASA